MWILYVLGGVALGAGLTIIGFTVWARHAGRNMQW